MNAGWRIKQISYAADGKPVIIGFENWAGFLALVSIAGFPIGCGWAVYLAERHRNPFPGVYLAAASWAVCLTALAIKNRLKKKNWIFVDAKCLDREVRHLKTHGGGKWASRVLCEFEHSGVLIQCTPTVHWSSFRSEAEAHRFLDSRIDIGGGCVLKVNPLNPKEANLSNRRTP